MVRFRKVYDICHLLSALGVGCHCVDIFSNVCLYAPIAGTCCLFDFTFYCLHQECTLCHDSKAGINRKVDCIVGTL